jgi:hypothetical protein
MNRLRRHLRRHLLLIITAVLFLAAATAAQYSSYVRDFTLIP